MLHGKGVWAYREGELTRALEIAPAMGVTHVLYKVGHGAQYRSGMAAVAARIRAAGLIPIGWMWLLLDDPQGEARVAMQAFQDGFDGMVFDTESERCSRRFEQADRLGQFLQIAHVDLNKLYNCSFPNISHHQDLPYDQMNGFCKGGLMPMAYGTFFAPNSTVPHEQQARQVIDEWTYGHYVYWCRRWGHAPPIYPVLGPYHDEHGSVRMGAAEFQLWLDRLAEHGPSFFSVFTAAVINDDLLPLIQAVPLGSGDVPIPTGLQVQVVSPEIGYLNVRPTPSTAQPPIGRLDDGVIVEALESEPSVKAKVGRTGQWLRIRTPAGAEGYVAAWYLRLMEGTPVSKHGLKVLVLSPDVGYLNMRPEPSTARPPITQLDHGEVVISLEPDETTRAKLGQQDRWLHVRTLDGIEGYVYAWYLGIYREPTPGEAVSHLVVHSQVGLNIRRGAGLHTDVIWHVPDRSVLEVQEDAVHAGGKVGQDQWIKVRSPSLHTGYVNGLYVQPKTLADKRLPVNDAELPRGECAWIFGIHAAGATTPADFRFLFQGKQKTGWVLFTEAIGDDPNHTGGHDYSMWSDNGYGVIVRLNYGYDQNGTLPVESRYANFARTCARYVQNSRGCHIWIIGNEQNNVREHPGGSAAPIEHITPRRYAKAFNWARQRIKAVQPNAIVVTGAVDPYNTFPWAKEGNRRNRPLEYFQEMLTHIHDLDGIALHTYTHWLDVNLITKPTVFQNAFLQPGTPHEHYYDFQAYRTFAEAIPEKWQDKPIYITETNHWVALDHQPTSREEEKRVGWLNRNVGWVRAAYAEINRWNSTPYAPQIHCLLLYRWTGDQWAIENKQAVQEDFRQALNHDYRWRR